jgi:hypothetical protein
MTGALILYYAHGKTIEQSKRKEEEKEGWRLHVIIPF